MAFSSQKIHASLFHPLISFYSLTDPSCTFMARATTLCVLHLVCTDGLILKIFHCSHSFTNLERSKLASQYNRLLTNTFQARALFVINSSLGPGVDFLEQWSLFEKWNYPQIKSCLEINFPLLNKIQITLSGWITPNQEPLS